MLRVVRGLNEPPRSSLLIKRPRLLDRLETALEHQVSLIVAPAGYGKSTLLQQFLATQAETTLLYDVREEKTLRSFVRGLVRALSPLAADLEDSLVSVLVSAQEAADPGADIARWMHAHLVTCRAVIAIDNLNAALPDDIKTIKNDLDAQQILGFLTALLGESAPHLRWIVATRYVHTLPIERWMAYQRMDLPIDEHDLRFTMDEARDAARSAKTVLKDDELSQVLTMTEGWPTALGFALRSATHSLTLERVEVDTKEGMFRYIAEQVYIELDDALRDFLSVAMLLPDVDIEVLQLAGFDDAYLMVEMLRERGTFLTEDYHRPGVFHCHDLFRAFVHAQLRRTGNTAYQAAHARAAAALEAAGHIVEAIGCWIEASNSGAVLVLLLRDGLELLDRGQSDVVAAGIDALSRTEQDLAEIIVLRGVIAEREGRYDIASVLLIRAETGFTDRNQQAENTLRLVRLALNYALPCDVANLLEGIRRDDVVDLCWRIEAVSMLAVYFARCGDLGSAAAARQEAISGVAGFDDRRLRARIFQRIGLSLIDVGDTESAISYLEHVAEETMAFGMHSLAAKTLCALGSAYYRHARDMAAWERFVKLSLLAAMKAGEAYDIHQGTLLMYGIAVTHGDEQAMTLSAESMRAIKSSPDGYLFFQTCRAEVYAWQGRFEDAYQVCQQGYGREVRFSGDEIEQGGLLAIFATLSGHQANARMLRDQLESNIRTTAAIRNPAGTDIGLLYLGLAEAFTKRYFSAQHAVDLARFSTSPVAAALRAFVVAVIAAIRLGRLASTSFERELDGLRMVGYGGPVKILSAALTAAAELLATDTQKGCLTSSEIAIVKLLASDLTPKEIAGQTSRSTHTVRTHIQNILQKLGVHDRRHAIAMAKQMGLIKDDVSVGDRIIGLVR